MGRDEAGEGPEKTEKPVFLENTGFLLQRTVKIDILKF